MQPPSRSFQTYETTWANYRSLERKSIGESDSIFRPSFKFEEIQNPKDMDICIPFSIMYSVPCCKSMYI